MARKFTVKELAHATGQTIGTVNKHFQREKFRKTKDGFIDPDTDFNKAYINSVTNGVGLGGTAVRKAPVKKTETKTELVIEEPKTLTAGEKEYQDLEIRKKRAETATVERNAELKQIEIERKAGNLLPVDIVEKVLVVNLQSVFRAIVNEKDNISTIYAEVFGKGREEISEIDRRFSELFDRVIKDAEQDASKEIKEMINEFQDSRGRGERK